MDPLCGFCTIVAGEDAAARVVYRDDDVVAFFPLEPATRGHTLVVPRRHVSDVWGLRESEGAALSAATLKVAHAIRTAVDPDGLNIIQSNGQAATQTVPHVHVHVVPRFGGDRMPELWPPKQPSNESALDRTAAAIRCGLGNAPTADVTPEDRRQHLSFIQAVITRMSQSSSSAKTWLLPIVTAAYGFAIAKDAPAIALLGVGAIVIFGLLDANYLKQEREFRRLYDKVAHGGGIPSFSMNPTLAAPAPGVRKNYWPDWSDIKSWAIAPVYGPMVIAGLVISLQNWTIRDLSWMEAFTRLSIYSCLPG
ncbi:HIT domain-containing protein [Rhodococcus hoagii]|nr:HIT domain-containing protein [Prescottella equi]